MAHSISDTTRANAITAWQALPQKLATEDKQNAEEQKRLRVEKDKLKALGLLPPDEGPTFKDTWRQVRINEDGSRSKPQGRSMMILNGKTQRDPDRKPTLHGNTLKLLNGLASVNAPESSSQAQRQSALPKIIEPERSEKSHPGESTTRML